MGKPKPVASIPIADKPALSVPEAARLSGFGRTKLYEELNAGRLIGRKHGKKTVILRVDLDRWLGTLELFEPQESAA